MRLQKLNNLTIVFFIFIACTSLFGSFAADYLQDVSDKAEDARRRSSAYADQLMAGSRYLTDAVRSFAATGDPKYQKAYLDEVYKTRSRDKAVEGLRALGVPQQELALIEEAKLMSDTLIDLENQAFAAGDRGDLKRAVELVYGPEYQQALASIYDPINRFRDVLKKRADAEAESALKQAGQKRYISRIGNVGSYIVMLLIVALIYKRKIVQPIIDLSGTIQTIVNGDEDVSIAHLDEQNEIGDLARSLEQYRKMTQAMDAQNWIETNIGKLATLIQQAETESELA
ncbi:MAG: HAMP domain-containing protein, partial [Gammaproteobacteria bacterium]